ncbi:conserved oligomeric Golgi complex subunit 8 [Lepeophtheirus salmonis]|uniref:conserved oligomeric Golgi complex subunit 8 n=1 Tax=Lepeophtheirus salmonis TaxID=72036 RepID=UPI001AE850C9|nr:conserved oligomeric Golgi complex subunit 8-like [Lepeophtheirus salmonis]
MSNAQFALFGNEVDEEYLYSLGSLGWEGVKNEAIRVKLEKESLLDETLELAFGNYKTFIEASEQSKAVNNCLSSILESNEKVSKDISEFSEACEKFQKQAEHLSNQRKATSLVLEKHTRLLEILELPQLCETCVRNGSYEEALELQRYALKLDKKLGSIPIISDIVKSVKDSSHLMLNQLLSRLKTQIALPACLRVVGYLRRMDVYSESELRVRFLQARESWLNGIISTVARTDDSYDYLSKVMELTRVHLFEIVTQYRAIFTDDDPILSSPLRNNTSNRQLFSAWIQRRVTIFIKTVKDELNRPIKYHQSSIDALLGQAMYFGQSMGRVGVDFRVLLIPVFTDAVKNSALRYLTDADIRFRQGMEKIALKNSLLPSSNFNIEDPNHPPMSIMEFLPLAEVTNSLLSCLNETRLCAPLSLSQDIGNHFENLIYSCTQVLGTYPTSRFSDTEWNAFKRLISVYSRDFIPFIIKSFNSVFPKEQIGKSIGIAPADVKELNRNTFIEPLRHLLPHEIISDLSVVINQESVANTKFAVDRVETLEDASKDEVLDAKP